MEKDKYYTPTIEEFHVGFQFDINDTIRDGTGRKEWSFNVKTSAVLINYIKWVLDKNPEDIKVKYLDREDIESLGWEFEKIHAGLEDISFSIGEYEDILYMDYNPIKKYMRIAWLGEGDITRFSGYIKNKSELKKLMQQLNING